MIETVVFRVISIYKLFIAIRVSQFRERLRIRRISMEGSQPFYVRRCISEVELSTMR